METPNAKKTVATTALLSNGNSNGWDGQIKSSVFSPTDGARIQRKGGAFRKSARLEPDRNSVGETYIRRGVPNALMPIHKRARFRAQYELRSRIGLETQA